MQTSFGLGNKGIGEEEYLEVTHKTYWVKVGLHSKTQGWWNY